MACPAAAALLSIVPFSLPARLRRWLRIGGKAADPAPPVPADPLLAAGRVLRQGREARGLTLRDMALATRISTPVLEALERGWRDHLPEPTYLRTMLPLLERHLELEPGSLEGILPATELDAAGRRRLSRLQRFTPGSIEVYSSWQGTVLYGLLTLGLIHALNLQQQHLAAQGLLALSPIPPLPQQDQLAAARPEANLLAAWPDLRPLERPDLAQALRRLAAEPATPAVPSSDSSGVLVLRLQQPTRLSLRSGSGPRTDLQGVIGELALPIEDGFQLQLEPAPAGRAEAPAVEWNGSPLAPLPGSPAGRYGVGNGGSPRP